MSQCYRAAKTVPVAYARLVEHCVERVERVVHAERSIGGKAEEKKSMQKHRQGPPMRRHQEMPQTTPPDKSRGYWTKFSAFGMHAKTCRRCKRVEEEPGAKTSGKSPAPRHRTTQQPRGLCTNLTTLVPHHRRHTARRLERVFDSDYGLILIRAEPPHTITVLR